MNDVFSVSKKLLAQGQNDPAIGLLAEAFDFLLHRQRLQINQIENDAIESLFNFLGQEKGENILPPHILVHSINNDADSLSTDAEYIVAEEQEKFIFRPTMNQTLFPGTLKFFVKGHTIMEVLELGNFRTYGSTYETVEKQVLLLGLSLPDSEKLRAPFSLYFEADSKADFSWLPFCSCRINGYTVEVRPGFQATGEDVFPGLSRDVVREINAHYERHAITLFPTLDPTNQKEINLHGLFQEDIPEQFRKLLWIELKFPPQLNPVSITPRINSFPLVNLDIKEGIRRDLNASEEAVYELPLEKEHFLGIHTIKAGDIVFQPTINPLQTPPNSYILTKSIAQSSPGNLLRQLEYLDNLVEEQQNFWRTKLESIDQGNLRKTLTDLKSILSQIKTFAQPPWFVILSKGSTTQGTEVRYWVCKNQELVSPQRVKDLDKVVGEGPAKVVACTPLITNESLGTLKQKLSVVRRKLMTPGSAIVTIRGIQYFCMEYYGDILDRVEVAPGVSGGGGKGLHRTVEVTLYPKEGYKDYNWNGICAHLEVLVGRDRDGLFPIKFRQAPS